MPSIAFHNRLLAETTLERDAFLTIPVISRALAGQVDRPLYLAFLCEAYHHVRHTCPLLAAALSRVTPKDKRYREALIDYIAEERGHEDWILDDIAAIGGDAEAVRLGSGGPATRIMVAYAYDAIQRHSPYALLGMVHVLEGMSVQLAERAAAGIAEAIGAGTEGEPGKGFSYLMSHGALDVSHVRFFDELVDDLPDETARFWVIDTARMIYGLYGNIFRSLLPEDREIPNAA